MSLRCIIPKLMDENNIEEIIRLSKQDLFGEKELDIFLQQAIQKNKKLIWIYLLYLKNEKYGFTDKDYRL